MSSHSPKSLVVLGLGQSQRGDDMAGLEAVRLWEKMFPSTASHPQVRVEYAETPGLTLLALLEGANVAILVDAIQSGSPPGTVRILTEEEIPAFLGGANSAHGWGPTETLAIGRRSGLDLPSQVIIVGLEAKQVEVGAKMSTEVQAGLILAAQEIERLVQKFLI